MGMTNTILPDQEKKECPIGIKRKFKKRNVKNKKNFDTSINIKSRVLYGQYRDQLI